MKRSLDETRTAMEKMVDEAVQALSKAQSAPKEDFEFVANAVVKHVGLKTSIELLKMFSEEKVFNNDFHQKMCDLMIQAYQGEIDATDKLFRDAIARD